MGNGIASGERTTNDEFVQGPRRQFVEQPRDDAIRGAQRPSRNPSAAGTLLPALRVIWPNPSGVQRIGPPSVIQNPLANSMEVRNFGWVVSSNVFYDPGHGCVPEPARAEDWEVGFIQNVLEDDTWASYQGVPSAIHLHYGGRNEPPLLDALRRGAGTQAWLTPDSDILDGSGALLSRAWTRVRYGGGNLNPFTILLVMRDTPSFSFYQRRTGSHEPLLALRLRTRFQIWVAAKPALASSTNLTSYHVLSQSNPFIFRMDVIGDWSTGRPRFNAIATFSNIGFPSQCRGRILCVDGPTANEVLGGRIFPQGIGPRWRDTPEQTRGETRGL